MLKSLLILLATFVGSIQPGHSQFQQTPSTALEITTVIPPPTSVQQYGTSQSSLNILDLQRTFQPRYSQPVYEPLNPFYTKALGVSTPFSPYVSSVYQQSPMISSSFPSLPKYRGLREALYSYNPLISLIHIAGDRIGAEHSVQPETAQNPQYLNKPIESNVASSYEAPKFQPLGGSPDSKIQSGIETISKPKAGPNLEALGPVMPDTKYPLYTKNGVLYTEGYDPSPLDVQKASADAQQNGALSTKIFPTFPLISGSNNSDAVSAPLREIKPPSSLDEMEVSKPVQFLPVTNTKTSIGPLKVSGQVIPPINEPNLLLHNAAPTYQITNDSFESHLDESQRAQTHADDHHLKHSSPSHHVDQHRLKHEHLHGRHPHHPHLHGHRIHHPRPHGHHPHHWYLHGHHPHHRHLHGRHISHDGHHLHDGYHPGLIHKFSLLVHHKYHEPGVEDNQGQPDTYFMGEHENFIPPSLSHSEYDSDEIPRPSSWFGGDKSSFMGHQYDRHHSHHPFHSHSLHHHVSEPSDTLPPIVEGRRMETQPRLEVGIAPQTNGPLISFYHEVSVPHREPMTVENQHIEQVVPTTDDYYSHLSQPYSSNNNYTSNQMDTKVDLVKIDPSFVSQDKLNGVQPNVKKTESQVSHTPEVPQVSQPSSSSLSLPTAQESGYFSNDVQSTFPPKYYATTSPEKLIKIYNEKDGATQPPTNHVEVPPSSHGKTGKGSQSTPQKSVAKAGVKPQSPVSEDSVQKETLVSDHQKGNQDVHNEEAVFPTGIKNETLTSVLHHETLEQLQQHQTEQQQIHQQTDQQQIHQQKALEKVIHHETIGEGHKPGNVSLGFIGATIPSGLEYAYIVSEPKQNVSGMGGLNAPAKSGSARNAGAGTQHHVKPDNVPELRKSAKPINAPEDRQIANKSPKIASTPVPSVPKKGDLVSGIQEKTLGSAHGNATIPSSIASAYFAPKHRDKTHGEGFENATIPSSLEYVNLSAPRTKKSHRHSHHHHNHHHHHHHHHNKSSHHEHSGHNNLVIGEIVCPSFLTPFEMEMCLTLKNHPELPYRRKKAIIAKLQREKIARYAADICEFRGRDCDTCLMDLRCAYCPSDRRCYPYKFAFDALVHRDTCGGYSPFYFMNCNVKSSGVFAGLFVLLFALILLIAVITIIIIRKRRNGQGHKQISEYSPEPENVDLQYF